LQTVFINNSRVWSVSLQSYPLVMDNTTCSICVESFNRTVRKKVTCNTCHVEICAKCIKRFLGNSLQTPNCMQCHTTYTREFLDTSFSICYRKNVLRSAREIILVDSEKKHLPELMLRAEALLKSMEIRKELNENLVKMRDVRKSLKELDRIPFETKNLKDIEEIIEMKTILKKIINGLETEDLNLSEAYSTLYRKYRYGQRTSVHKVVSCITSGCKGFLDNDFKCGLCNVEVCSSCHMQKGDEHECKQENIDSVNLIQEETHPCPNCNTNIFKIHGCSQMFCTNCHTAFNWDTGRIATGRVHNPHYFEWLRTRNTIMPREMGDVPCGGMPGLSYVQQHMKVVGVPVPYIVYSTSIYKMAVFLQDKEMRRYPVHHGRDDMLDIVSIDFLADIITEHQWKSKLFNIEKTREMNTEKRLILDMILAVFIDYFNAILTTDLMEKIISMLDELEELRNYFNSCIKDIATRFDMASYKQISLDWSKFA
jgi:hypothetical protein